MRTERNGQLEEEVRKLCDVLTQCASEIASFADNAMPFKRPSRSDAEKLGASVREAGVLLALVKEGQDWHVVLMKRTDYPGVHGGQISIPGGERESTDATLMQTALREFEEEMGVRVEEEQVFGRLSERYIPPSKFSVQPFLAYLPEMPEWNVDESEVAAVLIVPVNHLIHPDAMKLTKIEIQSGVQVELPAYHWNGHVIWGATAIMLTEWAQAWRLSTNEEDAE